METKKRSLAKAVTWRLGGLAVTTVVTLALTKRVDLAAAVGLTDTAVKLLAYYFHERLWLRVPFGRAAKPEYVH